MKKLGVMIATAALSMTATVSAFAYHGYSHNYAANQNRNACYDYACDDNGAYCAGNYDACYERSDDRMEAYHSRRNYRGCAGNGYCSNRVYISRR